MKKVIAISGPPGSGSTTTAKILSKKLNLDYFSTGQVFKDLSRGKIREKFYFSTFENLCKEKGLTIPNLHDTDDSHGALNLWQTDFGKSPLLHKAIDELQIELAKKGNVVIDSKLSLHMIQGADKKIWLHANLNERSKRSAQRDNIKIDEAKQVVEKRQDTERKEWKSIYNLDYFTQEEIANIKIDTTNLSCEEVVEKILREIK